MPQLNGVVERAFVTVQQRAMAMMFVAQFTPEYQGRLWAEAVNIATMLTNTVVNSVNKECPICFMETSSQSYAASTRISRSWSCYHSNQIEEIG